MATGSAPDGLPGRLVLPVPFNRQQLVDGVGPGSWFEGYPSGSRGTSRANRRAAGCGPGQPGSRDACGSDGRLANSAGRGYVEEGKIAAPFSITVANRTRRFHLSADALGFSVHLRSRFAHPVEHFERMLSEHSLNIQDDAEGLPEIQKETRSQPQNGGIS